jgi:hypothetical protein
MASKKGSAKQKLQIAVKENEDEKLDQRKEYAQERWDLLEEGGLLIYEVQPHGEMVAAPIPGLVKRAVFDPKATMVLEDEQDKKKRYTVRC